MPRLSEPAFNSLLFEELVRVCPKWRFTSGAERTRVFSNRAKQPDLLIRTIGGNAVILENEFSPARTVEKDARDRLGEVLIDTSEAVETVVAVRTPEYLREIEGDVAQEIRTALFEYCVFTDVESEEKRWPESGWLRGNLRELADCVDLVSISERLLSRGTNTFESVVRQSASLIESAAEEGAQIGKNVANILHQESGTQTFRMAAAILTNATVYHDILSRHFEIATLDQLLQSDAPDARLLENWHHIVKDINFFPIFHLAIELLSGLGARLAEQVSRRIVEAARELAKVGVTTLYDLSGRMFQKLIADRKFLATFYTLPSSSALLAELALASLGVDWDDREAFSKLRIADLACGTGTLLSAAYRGILKRYEFLGLDSSQVHSELLSNCVYAADIMPAAAHMAASQLSSFHPQVKLVRTLVYTVPYGEQPAETGREIALGSLDLLDSANVDSLFGTGSQALPPNLRDSVDRELTVPDKSLDLVIMNPPFTSPTNHKITDVPVPSFAGFSTTQAEQTQMSRKLKRVYKKIDPRIGNGNAGLASNFCDIAHLKLKHGGVIALVLPIAALSGKSWSGLRDVLSDHYVDVTVVTISSSRSADRSFSADTGMAECLIVGRKKQELPIGSANWRFISLQKRPSTILEAAEIASALTQSKNVEYGSLRLGDSVIGQYACGSPADAGLASVHSLELVKFLRELTSGAPVAVRGKEALRFNLVRLEELGNRGPVDRDVGVVNLDAKAHRGPFAVTKGTFNSAMYPILWWHDHKRERQITVLPDSKGEIIPGREILAAQVWETASRFHLSRDFNTNSAAVVMCVTPERSLGGRAWPTFLCADSSWEAVLALWGNSTLGLMLMWWLGSKQHSGRSINTVTKLPSLLVIDPRQLSDAQLELCREKYEEVADCELLPAAKAHQDENRIALDTFVLRDLCGASESWVRDFSTVRAQWCEEPIVGSGSEAL